jgi:hypothetical protein
VSPAPRERPGDWPSPTRSEHEQNLLGARDIPRLGDEPLQWLSKPSGAVVDWREGRQLLLDAGVINDDGNLIDSPS